MYYYFMLFLGVCRDKYVLHFLNVTKAMKHVLKVVLGKPYNGVEIITCYIIDIS